MARVILWGAVAVAAFHVGYLVPHLAWVLAVYVYALLRMGEAQSGRGAFYGAVAVGVACYGPHLGFFWGIFHAAAIGLWVLLAMWLGFFVLIVRALRRWPRVGDWAPVLVPIVWTGLEYFRCELYPLRFAWLTPGFALGHSWLVGALGVYGVGLLLAGAAAAVFALRGRMAVAVGAVFGLVLAVVGNVPTWRAVTESERTLPIVGIQMELPTESQVLGALDRAVEKYPNAALFVLSEYTLAGPPTEGIKAWCRAHERHVLVGGIDPVGSGDDFTDTAFVVGPAGEVVFSQGKCVPIQFFHDGLPARAQRVWRSPWGNIGICICYDLSYSRVTDELVRQGAQLLIVPAMDALSWGAYEHTLHARVAPARAAEYHVPIIRVASSGISQVVREDGSAGARTAFGEEEVMIAGSMAKGSRVGRPVDRVLAPACVVLTGLALAGLVGRRVHGWARRRGLREKNSESAIPHTSRLKAGL